MAGAALLPALAGVFAMAGTRHVLIWLRNAAARENLWFGIASVLAAADVAINFWWSSASGLHMPELRILLAGGWLVAVTWFVVSYSAGGPDQRRYALLATLLFAGVCGGELFSASMASKSYVRVFATMPVAILLWLIADGALRMWDSARRVRTVSLVALGVALVFLALQGAFADGTPMQLSEPGIYAFLLIILVLSYETAGTIANSDAASERQQQELAHASRLAVVGQLTASIAHEINQPLGAILSNTDAGEILLEGSQPPLQEIRKILGDIRRDGLRARDVIRQVRTLVRKAPEMQPKRLDANFVVVDVLTLLEREASRRRIFFATRLSPRPLHVHADRGLLQQVLLNLILNAMDALEAAAADGNTYSVHPPIIVGVSSTPHGEVEFQITDAGTGIPVQQLNHLFDSFYTSKPHGMGLGLSIARSIVEAHGGRIRAENNRRGGATFRVTLPPHEEPTS